MNRINLYILLSHIATGVALFVGASGAVWAFFTYIKFSFVAALAAAVIGVVPGLFMLIISEALHVLILTLQEKQKQTQLLASIARNTAPAPQGKSDDENLSDH